MSFAMRKFSSGTSPSGPPERSTTHRSSAGGRLRSIRFHQSVDDPQVFLVYETFENEAAFKAHFETNHFKTIVEPELVPIVSKRERTTYRSL